MSFTYPDSGVVLKLGTPLIRAVAVEPPWATSLVWRGDPLGWRREHARRVKQEQKRQSGSLKRDYVRIERGRTGGLGM